MWSRPCILPAQPAVREGGSALCRVMERDGPTLGPLPINTTWFGQVTFQMRAPSFRVPTPPMANEASMHFTKAFPWGFPATLFFFPNPTLQHKFIPGVSSCVSSPGDPGVLLSRSKSLVCSRWLLSWSGCIFIKRANAMICKT